jgi:DNA-binding transcriptional LysR family regulator
MAQRIDLNSLTVFNAVMAEQSITRAADVLAMTQPAVSNTLARLRVRVNDQLFFKSGRGIRPTAKALELWAQIQPAMLSIEQAMQPPDFDARTARRKFRVAASDIMVHLFWTALRRGFEADAPGIDLLAFPYRIAEAPQMLANNEFELVLGVFPTLPEQLRSTFLYQSDFVCAMRKGHPLGRSRLTVRKFAAADHMLVSLSGDARGAVDTVLAGHGLQRRIAVTVNSFGAVPDLLRQTDLIAVIPADLVRNSAVRSALLVGRPPIVVPPALISMAWHTRHDRDQGLSWIRKQFLAIAESIRSRPEIHYDW